MKIKTSELTGGKLDYMVAKAIELNSFYYDKAIDCCYAKNLINEDIIYDPSSNGMFGVIIIEDQKMKTIYSGPTYEWESWLFNHKTKAEGYGSGSTFLIAAMRCYVTSKFGDVVEFPDDCTI